MAAVHVVEKGREAVLRNGYWQNFNRWLRRLHHEIVETRPKLLLAQAWMHWNESDHGAIPELLDLAKRAMAQCVAAGLGRGASVF